MSETDRDARTYVRLARAVGTPEREIELDLEQRGYSYDQMSYLLLPPLSKAAIQQVCAEARALSVELLAQTNRLRKTLLETVNRRAQLKAESERLKTF